MITFSVGESTQTGDYVAEISCGEAEPKEVTITVTAPTTTEIFTLYNGQPSTSWTVGALNRARTIGVVRVPSTSRDEVSYTFSEQSEKFTVELTQFDPSHGDEVASVKITQIEASSPRQNITMTFTCGDASSEFSIMPK